MGGRAVVLTPSGHVVDAADGRVLSHTMPMVYFNNVAVEGARVVMVGAMTDPDTLDRQAAAYDLVRKGGKVKAVKAWHTKLPDGKTYGAPLVHAGLVDSMDFRGTLTVPRLATGEVGYHLAIDLGREDAMSSPVLAGDTVVLMSRSGRMAAVQAGERFELLGTYELETTRSTPVFVGGRMYLRGHRKLWAVGR